MTHDLLGNPITAAETDLLRVYDELKVLAGDNTLPPCAQHNVKKALACMWQVTNDLNLQFEQLYELGV
jgi:hypothetical protein